MAVDMNAALRAVSIAPMIALNDFRFAEDDVFFRLLHDVRVRAFIQKQNLFEYDVFHNDFMWGLGKFEALKYCFSENFHKLTDELEEEIQVVLDHSNGLMSSSEEVISKKWVTLLFIDILHDVMEGKALLKKDYKSITSAGLLQTNFCRWVLVYHFLRPSHQFRVLERFISWLKVWHDPNQ